MGTILALLKAKGAAVALGAGGALAFFLAKRAAPRIVSQYADKYLEKFLDAKNPEDRKLVKALVEWAEVKIPDRGKGRERYALVASKIVSILPFMAGSETRMTALIELAVAQMDDELKKKLVQIEKEKQAKESAPEA